ncbi:DUF6907 domain-containing protein [Planosporangium sp. 12N6]|uniref:DUF6907 domain-containing protein n=1 Tax=Planosporangium spinosum TaxID=3402278 RepID=UPI003CF3DDB0
MDEFAPARGAARLPHPAHCPPWCVDCAHYDTDPPGALLHRGSAATVAVYDYACELVDAQVRVAFWDKTPAWIGTDPADLERPYVEVSLPDDSRLQLNVSPGQARSLAAALMRAAVTAETAHPDGATPR